MSREWQPGDVAMVDSWRGDGQLAFRAERVEGGPTWCVLDGTDTRGLSDDEVTRAQPVAVVAYEDREQVERLLAGYGILVSDSGVAVMQAALREFAKPQPREVFEHYVAGPAPEDGALVSICGKTWKPDSATVSAGRCPTCESALEMRWTK